MQQPEPETIARAVRAALGTIRYAYLFGSTPSGRAWAASDVDLDLKIDRAPVERALGQTSHADL